ncbi:MAG TPA: type II secretion system F family protein [Anaerolineales bacterium]|nr:type II secretion system F family protein [Anaerolineales bacterium]
MNPTTGTHLLIALVGGLGVLLAFSSLFRVRPRRRTGLAESIDEIELSPEAVEKRRLRALEQTPALDRLLGLALLRGAQRLASLWPTRARVERLLVIADYPKPFYSVEEFYARKILYGAFLSLFALVVLPLFRFPVGIWVPAAVGIGLMGFMVPDVSLRDAARKRQEDVVTEMAFALDRLAMYVAAGHTLAHAIKNLAIHPGGPFVAELRQVAARYDVTGDLVEPLEEMARRVDVPLAYIFASQVVMVVREGGEVLPSLRALATEARYHLNEVLKERGQRNSLMRVIPISGMILPAVVITVVAPGAVFALTNL